MASKITPVWQALVYLRGGEGRGSEMRGDKEENLKPRLLLLLAAHQPGPAPLWYRLSI